ncbi:hypothetical protein C8R44DRAFT_876662 [Mycena epipterygia]|nr:hypothetical protein C8R44DRAFT_876662 [Mycena epipterygia]
MIKFAFFGLTAAAALTAVVAVSISSRVTCGNTINTILFSPDPGFNCLAPAALNNVISLTITNASFDELTGAVDHWLTEMCRVGSCRHVPSSNDTINEILGNATAGGCGPSMLGAADYLFIRETMCLQDTIANKFCTTESITLEGPLKVNATSSDVVLLYLIGSPAINVACNDCTRAQYQLGMTPKAAGPVVDIQTINTTCGADFTATLNDTAVGITQAAVNSEFKSNGAGILAPTTCLLILVVSGFFALL